MFAKFAASTSSSVSTTNMIELPLTEAFLRAVVGEGYRLNYAGLAMAAKALGENTSGQKLGQRGSKLVKVLPVELQPHVCRKNGKYAKGVTWETQVPGDLISRPVITEESVESAVKVWLETSAD